jgi:hypothetical protein
MVMKLLAKQTLKNLKQKWEYSPKMDLKKIDCGYAN